MSKPPSGIIVGVLRNARNGDCTNGGLSSKHDHLTLILPEGGPFEPTEDRPGVVVEERQLRGHDEPYLTAYPFESREEEKWYMAGGNYIESCDSRFPGRYPIPVHDRTEE